jgi:plasmid stabilization system protein ParE
VKPYRFLGDAFAEFYEHVAYFDQHSPTARNQFIAEVYEAVRRLCEHPEIGSRITKPVRRWVLQVFPYSVLYVNNTDEIVIIAIAPHKRRPGYWRKRLRKLPT